MTQENVEQNEGRKSAFNINPITLYRLSPRSMTGENFVDEVIVSIFEDAI